MTTTARVIVMAAMLMLTVGAGRAAGADPPLEPLVLGGEQFFRLEWEPGERRGGPVVRGSIVNEWGFPARRVQLLVEGLDATGRVVFVATLFGCLATLSERASFQPLWRPPFLSALVPEDRCHLNGLALRDGRPAFVTAEAASLTINTPDDLRAHRSPLIRQHGART